MPLKVFLIFNFIVSDLRPISYIKYVLNLNININRLKDNICAIKKHVGTNIYAVVKADAYSHGIEICRYIESDVHGFAVSCQSEASELIKIGIQKKVLVLSPSVPSKETDGQRNIMRTVCSKQDLDFIKDCEVALKINTGMNRLGAQEHEITKIISRLNLRGDLRLKEVFTHFYSIEGALTQFLRFERLIKKIGSLYYDNNHDIQFHCCASNCLNLDNRMYKDAVRCGLAMYGYSNKTDAIKPVLSGYTTIEQINYVNKGEHIGYGEFVAPSKMKIAVLKIGYADGYNPLNGLVKINGKLCKIVGKICMDMCMADVSGVAVEKCDKAWILCDEIDASKLKKNTYESPYEVLTSFNGKRIHREYVYKD